MKFVIILFIQTQRLYFIVRLVHKKKIKLNFIKLSSVNVLSTLTVYRTFVELIELTHVNFFLKLAQIEGNHRLIGVKLTENVLVLFERLDKRDGFTFVQLLFVQVFKVRRVLYRLRVHIPLHLQIIFDYVHEILFRYANQLQRAYTQGNYLFVYFSTISSVFSRNIYGLSKGWGDKIK